MPADDDVRDLEVGEGVGDDGLGAEVRGRQDVGDVAVDEDVAGPEAEDGGFGDAGVGAAEPEDRGLLARGEGGEEVRVGVGGGLGPLLVLAQGELEGVCWGAKKEGEGRVSGGGSSFSGEIWGREGMGGGEVGG